MTETLDLSTVFKAVTKTLQENQQSLDEVDSYNHNHGSNMVDTFKLVQKAVTSKKKASTAEQLAYASKVLKKKTDSGSAQLYAQGLANAAKQFEGKELTKASVGTLINAMMGMEQSPEKSGGDLLSTLLGSLTGSQSAQEPAPVQPQDLLGSLLGGMTGSQAQANQPTQSSNSDLLSSLLGSMTGQQTQTNQPAQPSGDDLLGSLLGGMTGSNQAPQASTTNQSSDMLSSLLSGLSGNSTPQAQSNQSAPTGGILGSLLGSLAGSNNSQPSNSTSGAGDLISSLLGGQAASNQSGSDGIDAKDLLSAALAYFSAKQSGGSNLQAIMQALSAASPLGKSEDRKQSGALIVNTILNMLR